MPRMMEVGFCFFFHKIIKGLLSFSPLIIYIEDIYFFEVNAKYISLKVMKISVNSRVGST